jgi:hypothetical protein
VNEAARSARRAGKENLDGANDLRNVKLGTQDYVAHADHMLSGKDIHAPADKKGRYGITVPKPFSFDIREKTKAPTIAERKLQEMVAQKQSEEQNEIQH